MAKSWQEHEFYLTMHLYYRTPFGRQSKTNPEIIELAEILGRTPSSIGMRLCNYSACDPVEKARGIKGLEGGGKYCKEFWKRYHENFDVESAIAEQLWQEYVIERKEDSTEQSIVEAVQKEFSGKDEAVRKVRVRLAQSFFRKAVLSSYDNKCCITGVPLKELLIASHIVPWSEEKAMRANPSNGLCLSRIRDGAFDRGLITLDNDYRLVLSAEIKEHTTVEMMHDSFMKYEGKEIRLPEKNLPDLKSLEWHRENLFRG